MDPMQPGQPNQMGQMNQMPSSAPKRSLGPIIGIIVVVALLIVGALYFWGEKLSTSDSGTATLPPATNNTQQQATGDAAQGTQLSGSDDINTLDTELQSSGAGEVDLSGLE